MKQLKLIIFLLTALACTVSFAQNPPLRVALNRFSPPFVMQGAHEQLFGFDVAMMNAICKILERECQFRVMSFNQLLNAVVNKEADVAVGSIGITAERAALVNFSLPYLPSKALFMGDTSKLNGQEFSIKTLNNKRIGVEAGTVFTSEITHMGINNPEVVTFQYEEDIIEALANEDIDFALLDAPSAQYWQAHSSLKILGEPIPYGLGLGIGIGKDDMPLLQSINQALLQYQNSPDFKKDYNMYLQAF
ncbi:MULTISPECIES: transporter substrate-binding domain-containing protein [Legionella]|uniref:Transporter substrate-binding domain-containing protein n=1 Tax=Legionella septentrionalis TaxID=2498109 RepID=A0A3S0VMC1_9GAMM|nr:MULTISPECIES: transporter substrate-binding domain-containing protein [Legionella]MCP0913016.1 transporter substrate-binding domain-containing protein [Legionella sp. 27cVA30]RUQ81676.1 transporter substrate-binding domain-containing protein [Legionella septentrionalis]RUQ98519.1 transporter substrate-binding domain-containing protein [Legionella septentrionalis]RUR15346.1 transporter substrate-binding domain-containing protein [Legionella septentrionalis]